MVDFTLYKYSLSALYATLWLSLYVAQLEAQTMDNTSHNSLRSSQEGSIYPSDTKLPSSYLMSTDNLKIGPAIVSSISIVLGLVVCFAGYRLFQPTMFLCGFLLGGFTFSALAEELFKSSPSVGTIAWACFIIGGLIVGSTVLCLYSLGIFIVGATAGVLFATMVNTSIGYLISPKDPTISLIVLALIFGILDGILALRLEKPVLIAATSFAGAVVCLQGLGYYLGNYPYSLDLEMYRSKSENGEWIYEVPTAWWFYAVATIILGIIGSFIQHSKTAKDYHPQY